MSPDHQNSHIPLIHSYISYLGCPGLFLLLSGSEAVVGILFSDDFLNH